MCAGRAAVSIRAPDVSLGAHQCGHHRAGIRDFSDGHTMQGSTCLDFETTLGGCSVRCTLYLTPLGCSDGPNVRRFMDVEELLYLRACRWGTTYTDPREKEIVTLTLAAGLL